MHYGFGSVFQNCLPDCQAQQSVLLRVQLCKFSVTDDHSGENYSFHCQAIYLCALSHRQMLTPELSREQSWKTTSDNL